MNPLKPICLIAWAVLLGSQLSLLWPSLEVDLYWICLLSLPLLVPAKGLFQDRHYTYKWVGFLALIYFCVGISELFANPQLKVFSLLTTVSSTLLFLASIYYARYLAVRGQH
ncbi:MAG: putative membrane protein [Planctomycetota bacterium]